MADENTPPKDLEVRLTELENAVKALSDAVQPGTSALRGPNICTVCHHCAICHACFQCYTCFVCVIIVPQ